MCRKSKQENVPFLGRMVVLGVLVAVLFALGHAEGARLRPAVKTIKSEDGDIIDCVDVYKQPALDHPMLRNHTIEMRPSFIPTIAGGNISSLGLLAQNWQKNGSCPVGTIPIRRIQETDPIRLNTEFSDCNVEVARVELHREGPYFGAQGTISVWNLHVEAHEWSVNSVTAFDDHDSFMEAGWAASIYLFGDNNPRLFVNWMDAPRGIGCFNLRCPGFVQVSDRVLLGGRLPFVSQYDGYQSTLTFTVYNDDVQGRWWMVVQGEPVGYWPLSAFANFEGGPRVNWGGSVCNTGGQGMRHTTSQMGSGYFANAGYKKASHIRNIQVMLPNRRFVPPVYIKGSASNRGCYSVEHGGPMEDDKGQSLFYGGPGGKCCDGRCKK